MTDVPQTPRPPLIDTWWTILRWQAAIHLSLLAMKLAPAGTAKDRWANYNQAWAMECRTAWAARYPQVSEP